MTMFKLEGVTKRYVAEGRQVLALDGLDLQVGQGEFVAVVGRSGSGKSTLLMLLGGLVRPSAGRVWLDGVDLYALDARARAVLRATRLGFVFQTFHLIPYLTALQNVLVPTLSRAGPHSQRERARQLLADFGLESRQGHLPPQLSVGERQRVALARALLLSPGVLLADEPTGNLDPESAQQVMDGLEAFRRGGGTVVLVTHDRGMTRYATRTIRIDAGRLI
jgi:ABC-type lipoprotein export system ATPase subunit